MSGLVYFKRFNTENEYNSYIEGTPVLPNVSFVGINREVYYKNSEPINPYSVMPLTLEVTNGSGDLTINVGFFDYDSTMFYKLNDGEWTQVVGSSTSVSVERGDIIQFKGHFNGSAESGHFYLVEEDYSNELRYNVYGNVMSIICNDDFFGVTEFPEDYSGNYLKMLFYNCKGLVSAENLILPVKTMHYECYNMMFQDCISLTTAPALPATTLWNGCYLDMFWGCTSLTTAPELPVTTLANSCYSNMFRGCTSLTTAPVLPATTLANNCYYGMFSGCTPLNSVTCLATDISATSCTEDWLFGVASSGIFTKNSSMSSWTTGNNGIPSSWTVQDAS